VAEIAVSTTQQFLVAGDLLEKFAHLCHAKVSLVEHKQVAHDAPFYL